VRVSLLFNKLKFLIPPSLKGFSQVMLVENAISGSLIFLGITLYSPLLGLMALLSSFIGTGTVKYCGGDKLAVSQGIYDFNYILSSVAVILFLQSGWRWVIALVVAAIAAWPY
jgi:urea transporter